MGGGVAGQTWDVPTCPDNTNTRCRQMICPPNPPFYPPPQLNDKRVVHIMAKLAPPPFPTLP